ncbi:MAG: hypothetical protein HPZ91_05435 [Lentisphaeria bacterium]|nr:hypothetical protein [Lentisphaeria bacterium]
MKHPFEILCAVMLLCIAGAAETEPETVSPAPPAAQSRQAKPAGQDLTAGAVKIGDTTVKTGPDGKTETLIQSGNTVIYQKGGASTFSTSPKGETPQYVQDSRGQVRQVTPAPATKPMPQRPNPAGSSSSGSSSPSASSRSEPARSTPSVRENRPSPIVRPERPSNSSMPSSPFLRPNPSRR